ncbi:MAG: four helix bundle protein [Verrucomicrobia bacterium]|nr:four helix bundle protein [Verrucomicrobiota bacterium]
MTGVTTSSQTKAEQLQERLIAFAVRILPLANCLHVTFAGKHIADQLLRSGTSAAPNYAEARSAESKADFVHKLRIAVKELNETDVWLQITQRSGLLKAELLDGMLTACGELKRILGASIHTARGSTISAKQ